MRVKVRLRRNQFMTLLKKKGRTLIWFQEKFIPNKSANQCSKELNGYRLLGITQELQTAMYSYEVWQARLDKKMEDL